MTHITNGYGTSAFGVQRKHRLLFISERGTRLIRRCARKPREVEYGLLTYQFPTSPRSVALRVYDDVPTEKNDVWTLFYCCRVFFRTFIFSVFQHTRPAYPARVINLRSSLTPYRNPRVPNFTTRVFPPRIDASLVRPADDRPPSHMSIFREKNHTLFSKTLFWKSPLIARQRHRVSKSTGEQRLCRIHM